MTYHVYYVGAVNQRTKTLDAIKIGYSNNPKKRIKNLQNGNQNQLIILKLIKCQNEEQARTLEKEIKESHHANKLTGEWFSISARILDDLYLNENAILDEPSNEDETKKNYERRVLNRIKALLKETNAISAKTILNRMRWATIEDVISGLKTLMANGLITRTQPKRTVLYTLKGE